MKNRENIKENNLQYPQITKVTLLKFQIKYFLIHYVQNTKKKKLGVLFSVIKKNGLIYSH